MIQYNVTFGTEEAVIRTDDFESPEEVAEFVSECVIEHGEGEFTVQIAAFEADEERLQDEP
jgi:hypothetical protein